LEPPAATKKSVLRFFGVYLAVGEIYYIYLFIQIAFHFVCCTVPLFTLSTSAIHILWRGSLLDDSCFVRVTIERAAMVNSVH
jgi:hypothetical protein